MSKDGAIMTGELEPRPAALQLPFLDIRNKIEAQIVMLRAKRAEWPAVIEIVRAHAVPSVHSSPSRSPQDQY